MRRHFKGKVEYLIGYVLVKMRQRNLKVAQEFGESRGRFGNGCCYSLLAGFQSFTVAKAVTTGPGFLVEALSLFSVRLALNDDVSFGVDRRGGWRAGGGGRAISGRLCWWRGWLCIE